MPFAGNNNHRVRQKRRRYDQPVGDFLAVRHDDDVDRACPQSIFQCVVHADTDQNLEVRRPFLHCATDRRQEKRSDRARAAYAHGAGNPAAVRRHLTTYVEQILFKQLIPFAQQVPGLRQGNAASGALE
ncbi:hypothetical protein D3C71_1607560 [compost metagenome]